jgi:outer membrane protein OmpA-like peptidoglycan-associated protein
MNLKKIYWFLVLFFACQTWTSAQKGLLAEYYNGTNFEKLVFKRYDYQLDFDWGLSGPKRGVVNTSYYSVKWTGHITVPVTGVYRFSATVDDGFRVWINNVQVLDYWDLHNSDEFEKKVQLQQGKMYPIRVEYFNAMLHGVFKLYWQVPNQDVSVVEAKYLSHTMPAKPSSATVKPPIAPITEKPLPATLAPPTKSPKPKPTVATTIPTVTQASPPAPVLMAETDADASSKVIFFEIGAETFTQNSAERLEKLNKYMQLHPSYKLKLMGHTDVLGDAQLNQVLSEKRAKAVAQYLVNKGLKPDRMLMYGYGSQQPVFAKPQTEAEHATNRRVAFEFIK